MGKLRQLSARLLCNGYSLSRLLRALIPTLVGTLMMYMDDIPGIRTFLCGVLHRPKWRDVNLNNRHVPKQGIGRAGA